MAAGDIGTVIDTLKFADNDFAGVFPDIIHIYSNIYAIAHAGLYNTGNGYIRTVSIADDGTISAVIDTLQFDTEHICIWMNILHVSGNVYAITYCTHWPGEYYGYLKTVTIDNDGSICAVVDSLEFEPVYGYWPSIIHVSGTTYAISYSGPDGLVSNEGTLKSITIGNDGTIGAVLDTAIYDTVRTGYSKIRHVSDNVYAIAYTGEDNHGIIKTVTIDADGTIGAVIDTLMHETDDCYFPDFIHISGTVYAVAYVGGADVSNSYGYINTLTIATDGTISDTVTDTFKFESLELYNGYPTIIPVSGTAYAIVYQGYVGGVLYHARLKTLSVDNAGNIEGIIDTLEVDTVNCGKETDIIHVSGNTYAIVYTGEGLSGFLKTVDIDTIIPTGGSGSSLLTFAKMLGI